jgi:hypothetical protein
MFAELSLKELKDLVRELRAHHNIAGYSRMKKAALVAELTARFVLLDGSIYLKGEDKAPTKAEAKAEPKAPAKAEPKAPAAPKPRAKKNAPKLTEAEITQKINKYFAGQDAAELIQLPLSQVVAEFEAEAGVKIGDFKPLFKDLARKFLQKR